jgi:hypothetical protein
MAILIANTQKETASKSMTSHFSSLLLEHMTKEQSQALVDRALTKAKYVVISIPIHHSPQGAWGGNPYEIHVKDDWTHEEVMESFPRIKQYLKKTKTIGVYWIEK